MHEKLTETRRDLISRRVMIYYSLPHLTHAVVLLPMALFIPSFYSDELALPLAGVGIAIAASRILDVITDPVIGILSDRLRVRWGSRKPWLIAGTPLLMLSSWMVFAPTGDVSITYLLVWSSVLFFAYTLVDLPYKAWGAELSTDYSERSRVTAWREGLGAAGQVFLMGILVLMGWYGYGGSQEQLLGIALAIVFAVPLTMVTMLMKVPEPPREQLVGELFSGWSGIALVLQNRAFLRTLAAIFLLGSALLVQATLHKLVLTHVVGSPELFVPMLILENLAALAALPVWLRISDRIGKHRAVTLAALWVGLWSLAFPLVGQGDSVLYVSLIALRGSSFTSIFFLSNSIAADVVDEDTVSSGQQRTGLYFAVWGMVMKLSVAVGIVLGTVLPATFGFEPSDPNHSESALFALMVIYGWLPCLIMVLGAPILWSFPLTRERQQMLRSQIDARRVK